jgi:hypothetical protein
MRWWSDLELGCLAELDTLIDEISEAALEAIEQAAGEAAKAAVLEMLEREAAALREATRQHAEAQRWRIEANLQAQAVTQAKRKGIKTTFIAGISCLLGGLIVGSVGAFVIGGR